MEGAIGHSGKTIPLKMAWYSNWRGLTY